MGPYTYMYMTMLMFFFFISLFFFRMNTKNAKMSRRSQFHEYQQIPIIRHCVSVKN